MSAIDTKTLDVNTMHFDGRPYVIALSPDGKRLYVGVNQVNEVTVIDTETDTIVNKFKQDDLPASIIVSPDGKTLYVAFIGLLFQPGKLIAIDAETGALIHDVIETEQTPAWITIGKDGSRVYALNFLSDSVTVVDTAAWNIVKTIKTGINTQGIIGNVTPDGSRLYVTNHGRGDMDAIDTETNEVVQTIQLDGAPVGVQFTPDGKHVWTTDFGVGSIGEAVAIGLNYLLHGDYQGQNEGQVREWDVETGEAIGSTVKTKPGATSVIVVPGDAQRD